MFENDFTEEMTFAPPQASGPGLTSFHRLMGAIAGEAIPRITRLVQRRAEELKRIKDEMWNVTDLGRGSPVVYR